MVGFEKWIFSIFYFHLCFHDLNGLFLNSEVDGLGKLWRSKSKRGGPCTTTPLYEARLPTCILYPRVYGVIAWFLNTLLRGT